MQSFGEILEGDPEYLPAVLGMATGFMIEKNQVLHPLPSSTAMLLRTTGNFGMPPQHKARNLLKRVGKMEMSQHDGEDFEKANLLLSKFYIDKVCMFI